jgi:DNA-binding CsgD family transcriptional regulator
MGADEEWERTEVAVEIVGQIYRAALDAKGWDAVIASLGQAFRSPVAGMFTQDTVSGEVSTDGIEMGEKYHRLYAERIAAVNPWISVPGLMRPGRILSDESLEVLHQDAKAYVETEFHQDFAQPQGFRHSMGGTLIAHGHRLLNFTYFRGAADGPYSAAEMRLHGMLSRHIAAAIGMSGELTALRRQESVSSYLVDRLAFGVILLDADGRVLFANREAGRLLAENDGLGIVGGFLRARYPQDARRLDGLVHAATSADSGMPAAPARTIVARPSGRMALSISALPVPCGRTLFDVPAGQALVLVSDPERRPNLEGRYLAERFGFGRNEARLAAALAQGFDLREAASLAGLTYATARWYLKGIFEKTGTHRQTELVALLLADLSATAIGGDGAGGPA